MKKFKQKINPGETLSLKENQLLEDLIEFRYLKKDELFIRKGQHLDSEIFIEKGIVRAFIVDDDGNEKTIAFFEEGEFMNSLTLRTSQWKSLHYYQALTCTTTIQLSSTNFKNFLSSNKQLSAVGKLIKEREVERLNKRDLCILQVRGVDKYLNFKKFFPNIEKDVSQKHIASYLGITPVSLSRLKKK